MSGDAFGDRPAALRLDLVRVAAAVRARARTLLAVHAAVGVVAVAVVLVLPRTWASSVTLVPAPRDGLSLDLAGTGAALAGGSLQLGAGPTPQDQLRLVVRSRAVADTLVSRFDLVRRWNLNRRIAARERLAERTTVTTPREGHVVVTVEAERPAFARDLAAAYAQAAAAEAVRLRTSLAAQRRLYLESRLRELERDIAAAGARVRAFEERHGVPSLSDQARETMDAAGTLQSQRALLETELAAARRYFAEGSPEVATLRDRIAELGRQLDRLAHGGGPLLPRGDRLPALKQDYLLLTRDQASLLAVAEVLRRVHEQARVEESSPVPTFSVLDAAELPERHAFPRRGLTVALALALACAGSLTWIAWRVSAADVAGAAAAATSDDAADAPRREAA